MPDEFYDEADDDGANDYIEVLKAVIGGLNLLVDTLMGNSVDGVETTPEEQRQAWEDGKEAGRQRMTGPNPYRTTTEGRYLLAQLWLAGRHGVWDGHLS
ncbi:hypothetical protein [Mycobacteroides abscessus]|uniref:hypothetical protein n=1 Tax=Mycobacteroides abscessus TaxID=36809 RepID=UPI00092811BC|nr:hypothetical protein [Mycobacteroides abscessus]SIG32471.1 Uncharacterised protein [Mycobacteroides abscessus subsp. abscessus]SIG44271.1 Uncharacterised protein [Mycobacteroides abscessus subsp. abscessus]SIM97635.1 Uncharacterised protein [Mycobacteroides abscessus subsp. abscessus]SIN10575.1 Uncharacterised protein [Mycobacteroides abscessus subsp. abscessus]SIN15186.1 Uncharacterised protein [Mycobacteroides abscessus subsp. abscessus]